MKFTVSLAGVNIEIKSIYGEVFDLCRDYVVDDAADFAVFIEPSDIEFERQKSMREAEMEHIPYGNFSESYLETLAVYRKIARGLLDYNVFLMHGAVVGLEDKAYLFTAPSGLGKTTHTRFWLDKYPDAFILNGDKPLIKIENGKVFACGSPWAGKEGQNRNVTLPLAAVAVMFRGKENQITPVGFDKVMPLVIAQTYRPSGAEEMKKTLELIKTFGKNMKFYALFCNLDPNAAVVAKEGMST